MVPSWHDIGEIFNNQKFEYFHVCLEHTNAAPCLGIIIENFVRVGNRGTCDNIVYSGL